MRSGLKTSCSISHILVNTIGDLKNISVKMNVNNICKHWWLC